MTRMTQKQREMHRAIKRLFPNEVGPKTSTQIKIVKEVTSDNLGSFVRRVEEYLERQGYLVARNGGMQKSMSNFSRTGITAVGERIYQVRKEQGGLAGTITYTQVKNISLDYTALIELDGFDKKSSLYKKLVRDLETFAQVIPNSYEWFRLIHPGKDENGKDLATFYFDHAWERDTPHQ